MSISSISTAAPVTPPTANPPAANPPKKSDDSDTQTTVSAPLPPGQGTRIDQIV